MAIAFHCPRCQAQLTVADDAAGKKQRCPECQAKLRIPAPVAPPIGGGTIEFLCPRCQARLTEPAEAAGKKQLCPQCHGKLRVPAPAAPPSRGTIDFLCPRCHAAIRVPDGAAGTKQACPGCQAKVRVPIPETLATAPRSADEERHAPVAQIESPKWEPDDEEFPEGTPASVLARSSNPWALLIPVLCLAVLAAAAAWLLHKPEQKLEGTLEAERVTDIEFGPFRVDNRFLGVPKSDAEGVFSSLESDPLHPIVSQLLILEFQGSPAGITIFIRAADSAEFCRVDPRQNPLLAKHIESEKNRYEDLVRERLSESVPRFLKAIENRPEGARDIKGLAEFRNSVGLASLVGGLGYQVQGVIGKQALPCVHEDVDGRLYFALPLGTKEFEIIGRPHPPEDTKAKPLFPGRYKVNVSGEPVTVNKEAPDPKKKIRKLLRE